MPQQYTVQSGDNLSSIGSRYGVPYQQITGYASGNPNLIRPGEILTIPDKVASPTAGVAPAAPVSAVPQAQPQQQIQQPSGGGDLVSALVAKGYSQINAENEAKGPRAAELAKEYGVGGGGSQSGLPQAPTFDLVAATNAAFNTPEIQAANKAITDRQTALTKASAEINDNPFYSEATRVGKQAQLTTEANNDIKVQQDVLSRLQSDAQIKVNAASGQYNINRQAYQDTLSQFDKLLSAGILTNASPQDLANYSVQTGIPYSALQGIQQKEQNDNVKTQLITSTDNAGNVTITAVDSKTGKIISQTKAGQIDKTAKATGVKKPTLAETQQDTIGQVYSTFLSIAGSQGFVSKEDWAKMKTAALTTGGLSSSQFDSQFKAFKNPEGADNGYIYQ